MRKDFFQCRAVSVKKNYQLLFQEIKKQILKIPEHVYSLSKMAWREASAARQSFKKNT
jgi:hypothetical protein